MDSVTRYKNKVIYPQFLSVFNIWDYYYSLIATLRSAISWKILTKKI
jgi:hypothetical protein